MLRYKNSLLERILLEKGSYPIPMRPSLGQSAYTTTQASMFKPSFTPRLAAPTWARLTWPRTWSSRPRSSAPS